MRIGRAVSDVKNITAERLPLELEIGGETVKFPGVFAGIRHVPASVEAETRRKFMGNTQKVRIEMAKRRRAKGPNAVPDEAKEKELREVEVDTARVEAYRHELALYALVFVEGGFEIEMKDAAAGAEYARACGRGANAFTPGELVSLDSYLTDRREVKELVFRDIPAFREFVLEWSEELTARFQLGEEGKEQTS